MAVLVCLFETLLMQSSQTDYVMLKPLNDTSPWARGPGNTSHIYYLQQYKCKCLHLLCNVTLTAAQIHSLP